MRRFAAVSLAGLLAVVACEDASTGPTTAAPGIDPSFNQSSGNTRCVGTLPPGTYHNVFVPPGEACVLTGSVLTGNLVALPRSSLEASNNTIEGSVFGQRARQVDLRHGGVGGSVHIVEGEGDPSVVHDFLVFQVVMPQGDLHVIGNEGGVYIVSNSVMGNVKVMNNTDLESLLVQFNNVGADIHVFNNRGAGGKVVSFNNSNQRVKCKHNEAPFVGSPNFAPETEDQCGGPSSALNGLSMPAAQGLAM